MLREKSAHHLIPQKINYCGFSDNEKQKLKKNMCAGSPHSTWNWDWENPA